MKPVVVLKPYLSSDVYLDAADVRPVRKDWLTNHRFDPGNGINATLCCRDGGRNDHVHETLSA